jgi:hypothetical protein
MSLQKDLREFIELLSDLEVRFLIVGAFAVAYQAIEQFGFGDLNLRKEDFMQEDQVIQIGVAPNRVDIMTFLSGSGL